MSEEFTYAIGNEIIQKYDREIVDSLPELYPDEGKRAIVEVLLIPQFREKLNGVFEDFLEGRAKGRYGLDKNVPVSEHEIVTLCSAIDNMIEENREVLRVNADLEPAYQYMQENRKNVKKSLDDVSKSFFLGLLANQGITNRLILQQNGPKLFQRTSFPPYGKGHALAGKILGRTVRTIDTLILDEIADKVGFEKPQNQILYLKVLDKHGISNRLDLLAKGSTWFIETDFYPYGKGTSFARTILEENISNVTHEILEKIADKLAFEEVSLSDYVEILKNQGIVNHFSLYETGIAKFKNTRFVPFGKGQSFAGRILGKTVSNVTNQTFEEIAEKLGFEGINDVYAKLLSRHDINNRTELIEKGVGWFKKADFSPFGKGASFASKILNKKAVVVTFAVLEEIADKLGYEEINKVYLGLLAKNGISNRLDLIIKGPQWFKKVDFHPYGKGQAFAGKILSRTMGNVTIATLEEIADKLGFEKINNDIYIDILANHGISNRLDFIEKGSMWFKNNNFSPFGKGGAFAATILNKSDIYVNHVVLNEIADKLGFEKINNSHYLDLLAAHGVHSRLDLITKGPVWFMKTEFTPFGKGGAFAKIILDGNVPNNIVTSSILLEVADKLGYCENSNEAYINILLKLGIVNRISLLVKGPTWFTKTDFNPFGKGTSFAGKILKRPVECVTNQILEEIADELGFETITNDTYRDILASKGINTHLDMLKKGSTRFKSTEFPPFGKGLAFAIKILEKDVERVTHEIFKEIADKLGLKMIDNEDYLNMLSFHGINNRASFINKTASWFRKTDFPPFGKGKAFVAQILGRSDFQVKIAIIHEIADILFPE